MTDRDIPVVVRGLDGIYDVEWRDGRAVGLVRVGLTVVRTSCTPSLRWLTPTAQRR